MFPHQKPVFGPPKPTQLPKFANNPMHLVDSATRIRIPMGQFHAPKPAPPTAPVAGLRRGGRGPLDIMANLP